MPLSDEESLWTRCRPFVALLLGLAVAGVCLAQFGDVAEDVPTPGTIRADHLFYRSLRIVSGPTLTRAMAGVSLLGNVLVLLPITAAGIAYFLWRKRHATAGMLFAAAIGGMILNELLKLFFHRPRPPHPLAATGGYSFPSGHAMISLCVYGFLTYLALYTTWPVIVRALTLTACVLLVLSIGISRLYLGDHWSSDVGAGYLAGASWLAACIVAHRFLEYRAAREE